MIRLAHGDAVAEIDPSVGNIPTWRVGGRVPLHAAPWRDEADVQANLDLPLVDRRLAGDFFCMPFGRDDVENGPIHGASANTHWDLVEQDVSKARFRLKETVYGAHITKEIQLLGPSLLQTHIVEGGSGEVTFAHHPMTRMEEGGRLSFSAKRAVLTDPEPQHKGANLWALNQLRGDLKLDCEDGSQWDLRTYPAGHAIEDFAVLVEARQTQIGWTCLMRNAEDDMVLVLKDPKAMPVTMLWISNGGRDIPPYNSRHIGVLGIEDGCALGASVGLSDAQKDNRLTAMGVPTVIELGPRHVMRHAIVSLPRPPGWSELADVSVKEDTLELHEAGGSKTTIPFPGGHFA